MVINAEPIWAGLVYCHHWSSLVIILQHFSTPIEFPMGVGSSTSQPLAKERRRTPTFTMYRGPKPPGGNKAPEKLHKKWSIMMNHWTITTYRQPWSSINSEETNRKRQGPHRSQAINITNTINHELSWATINNCKTPTAVQGKPMGSHCEHRAWACVSFSTLSAESMWVTPFSASCTFWKDHKFPKLGWRLKARCTGPRWWSENKTKHNITMVACGFAFESAHWISTIS